MQTFNSFSELATANSLYAFDVMAHNPRSSTRSSDTRELLRFAGLDGAAVELPVDTETKAVNLVKKAITNIPALTKDVITYSDKEIPLVHSFEELQSELVKSGINPRFWNEYVAKETRQYTKTPDGSVIQFDLDTDDISLKATKADPQEAYDAVIASWEKHRPPVFSGGESHQRNWEAKRDREAQAAADKAKALSSKVIPLPQFRMPADNEVHEVLPVSYQVRGDADLMQMLGQADAIPKWDAEFAKRTAQEWGKELTDKLKDPTYGQQWKAYFDGVTDVPPGYDSNVEYIEDGKTYSAVKRSNELRLEQGERLKAIYQRDLNKAKAALTDVRASARKLP